MEQRRLGRSGLKVSEVGIGCNNFGGRCDKAATQAVVDAAIDRGVTLFDTADVYGNQQSETLLGQALGGRRNQVVIATKFAMPMGQTVHDRGGSRRYIMSAAEASLRRLGTDYIDLYQMHAPDPETPIEETLGALDDLVRQGKVRYIGCSNFSGWQIADADWTARVANGARFVSAQNHYSLLERGIEAEVLGSCDRFGLGMLPFFPLASGMLTGKYHRNEPPPQGTRLATVGRLAERALNERNFTIVEALTAFAVERGHSLLDLAFGWLLTKPVISSVIAGATSAAQVESNVAASTWRLDAADAAAVDKITETLTMCGRLNVSSGPLTLLFMDMVSQPYPGEDRHNMAPTEPVVVLRPTALGALEAATMRWWLTPYWSKEVSTRYSMFNAKAETIETSASFKEPFARRRCAVPVAGYYEWSKDGDRKLPYYIRPRGDAGMLLAGIWDRWRNGDEVIESFAVVTAPVHDRLAFVHRRQPVMLSRAEGRRWVDRAEDPMELKTALLRSRLPVALSVVPVSTYVNTSRNDGDRCIEPIGRTIEVDAEE